MNLIVLQIVEHDFDIGGYGRLRNFLLVDLVSRVHKFVGCS